jgi:8-oxo-dGTP diphosphatase
MAMQRHTHLGVYGVLIRDNKVLLIKKSRGPHTGKWDFPGGSIEFGEEPYQTLLREFEEETGLTDVQGSILDSLSYTLIYSYRENVMEELHHIGILYEVQLLKNDVEIKAGGDGQDSLGAAWIDLNEIRQFSVTPFVEKTLFSRIDNSSKFC